LSPFSPAAEVRVAPSGGTTYRAQVRCSIDPACSATRDVRVDVYTGCGDDFLLDVTGGSTATIRWRALPQPPGISGYDVFRLINVGPGVGTLDVFTGGTFDGACFANAVPQAAIGAFASTTDSNIPTLGRTHMYQVGHSSNNAAAIIQLGTQPASSNRAGQVVTSGVSCP